MDYNVKKKLRSENAEVETIYNLHYDGNEPYYWQITTGGDGHGIRIAYKEEGREMLGSDFIDMAMTPKMIKTLGMVLIRKASDLGTNPYQ